MSEYCCEEVAARDKQGAVTINFDGTIDIESIYSGMVVEEDLPYCPWCGTKLLKEAADD